jgi:small-conductance mechanosensitive channel
VGSVAIALAAQETLSNLFSGFYILIDKPFRIGDCIKIDEGVEGVVSKIGWRSTHIKLYSNSMVVLPNTKVASSMITNYDLPESDVAVTVPVGVSYDSDLKQVEQVVLEIAFLVQNTLPFASKHLSPAMIFTSFGDSAVNFNVILRAQRITDASTMKHEFIKALHSRFKKEGLSIPYPHQVVQLSQHTH